MLHPSYNYCFQNIFLVFDKYLSIYQDISDKCASMPTNTGRYIPNKGKGGGGGGGRWDKGGGKGGDGDKVILLCSLLVLCII